MPSGSRPRTEESGLKGYITASVAIAVLLVAKALLLIVLPDVQFRVLDVLVIGSVAYLYGFRPALLAVVLSVVGYYYLYVPPSFSFAAAGSTAADWTEFGVLVFGDVVASVAMSSLRESRRRIAAEVRERKEAEEEMRRSRTLLAEAEKLSHTGAWEWDLRSDTWAFSDEWLAIHGTERRTLSPDELLKIGHPEDRDAITTALEKVRSGIQPYDIEHRIIRQDSGEVRTVRARGNFVRDQTGNVTKLYGFAQDITEQKQAEEALRESEAQLSTILENITEGTVVATMEGCLIHWNRAALQMHGYSSLEECQQLLPEFEKTLELFELDGTPVPITDWPMARVLRGQHISNWEARIRRPDQGWEKIFNYGGNIVRDAQGKPLLALLTMADITERKHAEEQVRQLNAELEQRVAERTSELQASNKELQTLSYSIMHDLRTPLRAIGGFSDTLLRHYATAIDERGQDYLQRISAAAQKMSRIIDDIHDLLRATRAEVHRKTVDMSAMAREILDGFRKSQPERRAEIKVEDGLVVSADAGLLHSALTNLLSNAWKFTSKRDITSIEVAAIEQNGKRVYLVRDNGVGFNLSYAGKLFMPFQRLHNESEFPGTGIGLALVQRILKRHGGDIWAESEINQGTTFYFTLGEATNGKLQDTAS